MHVLLWVPTAAEIAGGHRVQLERTAGSLRSLGVNVTVTWEPEPPLEGYDVIHGFGLSPLNIRGCRTRSVPVCLSTIYWSKRYTRGLDQRMHNSRHLRRRLRLGVGMGMAGLALRHLDKAEKILTAQMVNALAYESADLLLPNSDLEASIIKEELGTTTPSLVVPNGVDVDVFGSVRPDDLPRDPVVMYAGRFEPHKNQLGLIRALKKRRDYSLILVGPTHPHHLRYYETCLSEAHPEVEFVPYSISQTELVEYYSRARVHALPSWFETTGLVSLEAAVCGANIVSTNRGYAREYLGSLAWYCDPAEERSIVQAIDDAMSAPYTAALRNQVLDRYTWDEAARATLDAYGQVLEWRK